jgi:hypothetical protein
MTLAQQTVQLVSGITGFRRPRRPGTYAPCAHWKPTPGRDHRGVTIGAGQRLIPERRW